MMNSDEMLEKLAKKTVEEFLTDNPTFATFMGLHDYDDQLGDQGPEQIERSIEQAHRVLKELEEIEISGHTETGLINREIFQAGMELQLFQLEELKQYESDVDFGGFIGMALFPLFTRDFAPFEERMSCIAARLEGVPKAFEEFKQTIKKPINLWTRTAMQSTKGIPGLIQLIISVAENQIDGEVLERLKKAGATAIDTLKEVEAWLEELAKDPSDDWALGKENFEKLLAKRKLGLTSDEILELGYHYLDKFGKDLEKLADKISPGASIEEVREKLKDDHPKTFDETLAAYRKWVEKCKVWVIDNDFVTVRDGELQVVETPQFLTPIIPTAALVTPGMFEKTKIGEYIVTRPADEKDLREHFNVKIPNICIHEAYPGHFNEGLGSFEAPLSRFLLNSNEMVEGWAFYCEQATKDMGFHDTPESRFAQTIALMFRAARIIVDIKLSQGEMSFEEAVEFMIDKTGVAEASARVEVTRYTQSPGYPLSYLLGRHQIFEARKELEQEYADEFDLKLFHDTIVTSGRIPISYIPRLYRAATRNT